jgi:dTDP-4-dehydrorhamnose 3,5-epimerase
MGNFTAWMLEPRGLVLLQTRQFGDARGMFMETFSRRDLAALGIAEEFVQDNQSRSAAAGTVRGLHFQTAPHAQAKLVRCLRGAILDVAVDLRPGSPSFGRHVAVELTAANALQLFIPAGFAHGFCTLQPDTEVAYKTSDFYAPRHDRSVAWNDPALGIAWPVEAEEAVLSEKDRQAPPLRALMAELA